MMRREKGNIKRKQRELLSEMKNSLDKGINSRIDMT